MSQAQDPRNTVTPERLRTVALLIALAFSILTVFSVIGTPILNPLQPHSLSGASLAASNDRTTVIVDRNRIRLLFADDNMKIYSDVEVGKGNVPIGEVSDVALSDDVVYVAGLKRASDGEAVASESVLAYSQRGIFKSALWEESYDDDDVQASPTILDLKSDGEGAVVVRSVGPLGEARSVQLLRLDADATQKDLRTIEIDEPFFDASYDIAQDCCYIVTTNGSVLAENGKGEVRLLTDGRQLFCKAMDACGGRIAMQDAVTGGLLLLASPDDTPREVALQFLPDPRSVKVSDEALVAVLDDGSLLLQDLATQEPRILGELVLAPWLAFHYTSFFASIVFLAVMLVVWARKEIRALVKDGNRDRVREIVIASVAGILAIVATTYLSNLTFKADWALREKELQQMASYLGYLSPRLLDEDAVRELQASGQSALPNDQPALKALNDSVEGLVLSAHESGIGVSCDVFVLSEDGSAATAILSTGHDFLPGERVLDQESLDALRQAAAAVAPVAETGDIAAERAMRACTTSTRTVRGEVLGTGYVPLVTSEGTCWGVAQVSTRGLTFLSQYVSESLGTVLAFSIATIGVFLLTDEFLKSGNAVLDYRHLREEGSEWACSALVRPLSFLCGLASSMDYALVAVMARDLMLKTGDVPSSYLLSLPFLAATLGSMLSQLQYEELAKRLPVKVYMVGVTAIGIAGQALCLYALRNANFELYVVGRFVMSTGYGLTLSGIYGAPTLVPSNESMRLYADIEEASKASGIIAGILGGILVGMGNEMIYITSGIFGALLLCCLLFISYPEQTEESHGLVKPSKDDVKQFAEEKKEERKQARVFVFGPEMLLSIAFGLIPVTIAGGYRSYVFPLFLDSANFDKSQIANIWVICDVLLYLIINELRTYRQTHNRWIMAWVAMLFLGITFGLFSMNQSVAWAFLAAVVIGVVRWFAGSCRSCARSFGRKGYDLSYNQAFVVVSNTDSVIRNVRSVAMGGFLSLGTVGGCLALGAYFVASGVLYAITTHSHYKRYLEK